MRAIWVGARQVADGLRHDLRRLAHLLLERGPPAYPRLDSGPESVAKAVQERLSKVGVRTLDIELGSP